jgi:hypothetical protein
MWVPFISIKFSQSFVNRQRVDEFKSLYRSGVLIPPPTAYLHSTDVYVIQDGHHRMQAIRELDLENNDFGAELEIFQLPFYRKEHRQLFTEFEIRGTVTEIKRSSWFL